MKLPVNMQLSLIALTGHFSQQSTSDDACSLKDLQHVTSRQIFQFHQGVVFRHGKFAQVRCKQSETRYIYRSEQKNFVMTETGGSGGNGKAIRVHSVVT